MATVHLEALAQAVEAQLPDRHGQRLAQCIRSSPYQAEPELTWADTGLLLSFSLAGGDMPLATLPLNTVELRSSIFGEPVELEAEDVPAHPALAAWVGLTLAEAIGLLLRSGAVFGFHAVDSPFVRAVEVSVASGQVWAEVAYSFVRAEGMTLSAVAIYGDRPAQASASSSTVLPLTNKAAISGGALLSIGWDASARTRSLRATAPAVSAEDVTVSVKERDAKAAPSSGSLH